MHRQRIPEKDDLFSNWWQTSAPCVALFLKFQDGGKCAIMLDGNSWIVDTKNIRHNVLERADVS